MLVQRTIAVFARPDVAVFDATADVEVDD